MPLKKVCSILMQMSTKSNYPRDLIGYGANPPHPRWPGNARIAVQFVLNYEEAERFPQGKFGCSWRIPH